MELLAPEVELLAAVFPLRLDRVNRHRIASPPLRPSQSTLTARRVSPTSTERPLRRLLRLDRVNRRLVVYPTSTESIDTASRLLDLDRRRSALAITNGDFEHRT